MRSVLMHACLGLPAVLAGAPLAAQEPAGGDGQSSSHARMIELLEQVRLESLQHNPFLALKPIADLEAELARLPDDPQNALRWHTTRSLAAELLRVGRTEEAIETFSRAVQQLESVRGKLKPDTIVEFYFQVGTAYMRLGEVRNCCLDSNADSCILPIRGCGIHGDKQGSRTALEWFTRALESSKPGDPVHLKARWLLNIAHMTLGTYPDAVPPQYRIDPKVFASDEPFPRFVDIAPRVGLGGPNLSGGSIAEDFDGDGLLDIVISSSDTGGQMRYYANDASGQFVDRTEAANLIGLRGGLNMSSGDYDNDGDVDILVLRGAWMRSDGRHPKSLLQNDGRGVFTDVTFDVGLEKSRFPTQTGGFADYDNDGDLDLYIGNENDPSTSASCELYRNDQGKFTNVAAAAGVTNDRYTKGVAWGDYDGDRWPDLYLNNLGDPNRLYRNKGDGTFESLGLQLGVDLPLCGFPCWFFDFDQDGALDIFAASWGGKEQTPSVADVAASYLGLPHKGELSKLYKGDGKGRFTDVTQAQGLTLHTMPMGANFGDLDNDGFPDFYLGTGYPFYEALVPNVMYHNLRGKGFADVSTTGGFGHLQKGHAISFADLDNDGDQDVFEQMGGAYPGDTYRPLLFENPGFGNHWLKVRLVGTQSNRFGVGARIKLDVIENGAPRAIYKTVNTGGSFGCNPLRQELGLGAAPKIEKLEVYWPTSDTRQVLTGVAADQAIEIREGAEGFTPIPLKRFSFARE